MTLRYDGVMGFNINAMGVDRAPGGWGGLLNRIENLRPAACLIMDFDHKRAVELKQRFPNMQVVLRVYYDGDSSWRTMSAQAWLNRFGMFAQSGVALQYLNEPNGYDTRHELQALVNRCVEVAEMARARGIRLVLPNFAVGHPDLQHLNNDVFDPLIRELARGYHTLGLHEYARQSADEPDLITRYRAWLRRAKAIGVQRPRILITETGRDVGGGYGDGWRAVMSEQQYAALLRNIALKYAADGVSACIYGYGFDGDAKWHNFDIGSSPGLLDRLIEERVRIETPSDQEAQPGTIGVIKTPGLWVNLRSEPILSSAAAIIGRVFGEQRVRLIASTKDWYEVEVTIRGYVSKQNGRVTIEPES